MKNGPSVSYAAPKSIWDPTTKPNAYWQAFGRDGEPCDTWSTEELAEVGLAYALDRRIKSDYQRLPQENKERRYLNVLSRYVVALVHRQVCSQLAATGSKFEEVIRSEARFDEVTKRPYLEARKVLRPAYEARETASHYARQYIGKNDELFDTLNAQLRDALAMEGYFA